MHSSTASLQLETGEVSLVFPDGLKLDRRPDLLRMCMSSSAVRIFTRDAYVEGQDLAIYHTPCDMQCMHMPRPRPAGIISYYNGCQAALIRQCKCGRKAISNDSLHLP